jgi:hypothetical protein
LSAFESRVCSQAAVLRDLPRDLVGLGVERVLWALSFKEDLVSIFMRECYLPVFRKM